MAHELREPISEITESPVVTVLAPVLHFMGAVLWGTGAGVIGLLGFAILDDVSRFELLEILTETAMFGIVIGVFTLAGMLFIGMPVTMVLYLLRIERAIIYTALGAVGGFVFLPLSLEIPISEFAQNAAFATVTTLAGLATAYRWGRWRERVAKAQQAQRDELEAQRRSNPIHELIH